MFVLARQIVKILCVCALFASCSRIGDIDNCGIKVEQAQEIGSDTAVYAYPLMMMALSRRLSLDVSNAEEYRAPINQFAHAKTLPTPSFRLRISPSVDVLYSTAWLDLNDQPYVLHVPEIRDRYYLLELFDGWTNVFTSIGSRTTGSAMQDFLLCGPDFVAAQSQNLKVIQLPTNMVWVIGRTQCFGVDDSEAVNKIQSALTLTPLRDYLKMNIPPAELPPIPFHFTKELPQDQIADMNANTYFNTFSRVLQTNPPSVQDSAMVEKMARLGIGVGKYFEVEDTCHSIEWGLKRSLKGAKEIITDDACELPDVLNHWNVLLGPVGKYGTDYTFRAKVAYTALGTSLNEDIVTPYTSIDCNGGKLNGLYSYKVCFKPGELPPVDGFWSLTIYNDQHFLVPNPLNRYAIQSSDVKSLVYDEDGSLNIYLQRKAPKEHLANWLPAPSGEFNLIMRLYWPKPEVVNGSWSPPTVICTNPIE